MDGPARECWLENQLQVLFHNGLHRFRETKAEHPHLPTIPKWEAALTEFLGLAPPNIDLDSALLDEEPSTSALNLPDQFST